MSPASDDERTQRTERAKSRAFVGTILIAAALLGIGIVLIAQGGAWAFLGAFLFLLALSFGAASIIGLLYRRKARKVLEHHEWVITPVSIKARPRSGSKGRTIVELRDPGVTIAVTGLPPEVTNRIEREGAVEYAGALDGSSMLFTRPLDGEDVYIAIVPKPRSASAT